MVKDGELDTSIAESLNDTPSTSEEVSGQDIQTDHQAVKQNPDSTKEQIEHGYHANPDDTTNQNTAVHSSKSHTRCFEDNVKDSPADRLSNGHDDELLTGTSSQLNTSIRRDTGDVNNISQENDSNSDSNALQQTDHSDKGPIPEQSSNSVHTYDQSSQGDSQMGITCPSEESLPPQSVTDETGYHMTHDERNLRPVHLLFDSLPQRSENHHTAEAQRINSTQEQGITNLI